MNSTLRIRSVWLPTFLLLITAAATARARDWTVTADAPPGGDGTVERPFSTVHEATSVAEPGDRILLGAGTWSQTRTIRVDGRDRRVLLELPDGVEVRGAGRGATFLRAPASDGPLLFGVTAAGVGRDTILRDLSVAGPCFQGVNLRGASPLIERVDIVSDVVGSSSTGFDARDGSDPLCRDVRFDGGHSAFFVEFASSGLYVDCVIGRRPNEGAAISDATPVLRRCRFDGAGRDTLVLNLGSIVVFQDCYFGRGDRWTVRVASGYSPGTVLDLGGNRWFDSDPDVIRAAIRDAEDDPTLGARVEILPLADPVATESTGVGAWKSRFSASINAPR